jgi:hypothetical protein
MTYEVRYYQDWSSRYVVIATCASIDEARSRRQLSGDLIVDVASDKVVLDPSWLWDWECDNHASYAYQQLGHHRPGKRIW